MKRPLEGIRIIDVSDFIVGPFTTSLLANWGAEVIRVESRLRLAFRRIGPWGPKGSGPVPQGPESAIDFSKVDLNLVLSPMYAQFNSNKLSISLNLSKPEGRDLFKKLVKVSDVVIENLRFGIFKRWELDYPHLQKVKNDIIYASLQSMGGGPYEEWTTWGMNLLSFSGFAYEWGHPDTPISERVGCRYHGDYTSGSDAATAILAALFHRAQTGEGQYIEVSQVEATTSLLGTIYLDYFVNNRVLPPRGNRHPQFAPYNCYRCKGDDRWCVIGVTSEEEWKYFCQALEYTAWTRDTKFKDMESRLKNVEELDRNIERWTIQYTPHQVMGIMQYFGVPAGAVQNSEDVYHDIQLRARNFMVEQELPRLGSVTCAGLPVHLSMSPEGPQRKAPFLGEHNEYIYQQVLGMSQDEVNRLEENKVIY
jgi:benzylsuccinate CoA-transferase BbsF subunit